MLLPLPLLSSPMYSACPKWRGLDTESRLKVTRQQWSAFDILFLSCRMPYEQLPRPQVSGGAGVRWVCL